MARELYNWDQLESYAGYAFYLLKEKYPELINGFHSQYIEPDYVSLNPDDIISTKKQK